MEVSVIPFNEVEVVDKIYTACRTCYAQGTPQEQYKKTQEEFTGATGWDKKWKLINHVISSGHHSTLEHVSFTFLISGVSRALSHQLVRHRIGVSFSQQSQRYCKFDTGFEFVTPFTIAKNTECAEKYLEVMNYLNNAYQMLIESGIPAEDARMVLPNACTTEIIVSGNFREYRNFLKLRLGPRAQWEIRKAANIILDKLYEIAPSCFEHLKNGINVQIT